MHGAHQNEHGSRKLVTFGDCQLLVGRYHHYWGFAAGRKPTHTAAGDCVEGWKIWLYLALLPESWHSN